MDKEKWHQLSLCEQLGNIGSEISRAINWKNKGNQEHMVKALERGLELFDLTISDPKHKTRLRELLRAREVVCDYFYGDNEYASTDELMRKYFDWFALAALS